MGLSFSAGREVRYDPRGAALALMGNRARELLIAGPVGTGKTRACLEKVHLACMKYAGCRWLIARKTRKALSETALVTFEQHVVPPDYPLSNRQVQRSHRHSYLYPNGSEIVIGGFDDPQKIMSSEYDGGYFPEVIECSEEDIEVFSTRLRNGKMPYHQIIMDCNPDTPNHWVYKRCQSGKTMMLESRHVDNPRLHDGEDWTAEGREYMDRLESLSGVRRSRLLEGLWVLAEGARFTQLDPSVHLFDLSVRWPYGIPPHYTQFVSIDYGLAAPYCALWHTVDPNGDVYTYREHYQSGLTADLQARAVVSQSPMNETYYAEFLDPAMWGEFPGHLGKTGISAADIYRDVFGADARFGPLRPGYNKRRVIALSTLDKLLNRDNGYPNWYIERSCENLWRELQDARFTKNARDQWEEDLDKSCDDHAITAAYYGLHTHFEVPIELVDDVPSVDMLERERLERRRKLSERRFRQFARKHR